MIRNVADVERVAELADAFVDVDRTADRWMVGNAALTCSLVHGRGGTLAFEGLFIGRSDDALGYGEGADCLVTVGGASYRPGTPGSPFMVDSIDATASSQSVTLAVRFASRQHRLLATRRFVVRPGAAAVESWTEFEAASGDEVTLSDLNAFALTVPAGALEWVTGLEGADDTPSFTRQSRHLADLEHVVLASPVLSSLKTLPFFCIGNGHRKFFAGLAWSGGWTASFVRRDESIEIVAGLSEMSAVASGGRSIESPHAVVGVVPDQPGAETDAITGFVYAARNGRDFPAWATFNTWFLHGTRITEDIVRADMDEASLVGIELFQVDAGWYPGSRADAPFDFTTGLGSWTIDRERFPNGFAGLRRHADQRGLRLGIWAEPERIALDLVGRNGLAERFLAQQDGRYDPALSNDEARDAQICLGDPDARAWVLARLAALLDESGADNLKWDCNRWVVCTRQGHGHPADGGNYAHARGLYELLGALRARYPDVTIENCSGGARRVDFAMVQLTDTAWMDDRSAPSSHVRYNLDGLLAALPASYLFSYVMAHASEPIRGQQDIAMLVRSRMPGVVGLTADLGALPERERNELHQQIELAKRMRGAMGRTTTYTLTPQTGSDTEWRVLQQVSDATGMSAIYAYAYGLDASTTVAPRRIVPEASYELRSADRGRLGRLRGADLLVGGLEIRAAPESALQVLILEPVREEARVE